METKEKEEKVIPPEVETLCNELAIEFKNSHPLSPSEDKKTMFKRLFLNLYKNEIISFTPYALSFIKLRMPIKKNE